MYLVQIFVQIFVSAQSAAMLIANTHNVFNVVMSVYSVPH